MNGPEAVGADGSGNVYEVEYGSNQLQVFNSSGVSTNEWNGSTSGTAFNDPEGVAVDATNQLVYVSDSGNSRIVVFGLSGNYLNQWNTSQNGQLSYPEQVAVPGDGYIYVADAAQALILKYQPNGTLSASFLGTGNGILVNPTGVAVYSGDIFVADQGDDQVVVLNSSNGLVTNWGSYGNVAGQFVDPEELSIDSSTGNVYVVDAGNARVEEFTNSGTFINQFTGRGFYQPAFGDPAGIFVQNSNRIYVADNGNNDISVLGLCNGIITPTPTITQTPTPTASSTPTGTLSTPTPSFTPTITLTPTVSYTPTLPPTWTPMSTGTSTNTYSPSVTPTFTWTPNLSQPPGTCLLINGSFTSSDPDFINGSAVDGNGNLYLAQNDILEFNSQGAKLNEFGAASLQFPEGIAFNSSLNLVYVVDGDANTVDAFSLPQGSLQFQFGSLPGSGILNNPTGITMDGSGNLYVSDTDNGQVAEFGSGGNPVSIIGKGQLNSPEGIAMDGSGNLFVGDSGTGQIVKFLPGGGQPVSFNGNGEVGEPYEMKVDSNGLLWVGDDQNNRVLVFNNSGNLLNSYAGPDIGGTVFNMPMVSMDSSGNVYVPNASNALVQKFIVCEPTSTFTATFSPTNSSTNTRTITPTPTSTNTTTSSWTPSLVSQFTATSTPTGTPPTLTPTGSPSPTPTNSPTATLTQVPGGYVARINVGGDDYGDNGGNFWLADQGYVPGGGEGFVVDSDPITPAIP